MSDEEDVTAQLLRLAGAPPDPAVARAARVRAVVHREWQAIRRRRTISRGAAIAVLGAAASLLIAVLVQRSRPVVAPPDRIVATSERVQGVPLVVRHRQADAPIRLSGSMSIHADDAIETDGVSRIALQASDGSSVRIDRDSRVRFVAPSVIEVVAGGLYVSTADGSHGFEVRTPLGGVRDVGTQFEVRLTTASLRVRVRTGTVEIRRGAGIETAGAGTEAMVTPSGVAVRQVAPYGSEWAWTSAIAPPFAIEGQSLRSVLDHLATEEGWSLRYDDADVANIAARVVLHGSVEGLSAEEALEVALATSGLQYRLHDGTLLVSKRAAAR
jgi:ferric-dicitrate binding protein FerR (iron transport regulator)